MLKRLRGHSIATPLAGAMFAGLVAIIASIAGLPDPYPLIVGLAAAVPILNVTSSAGRFDIDAYQRDRGRAGMIFDAVLSGLSGVLIGSLIATLSLRYGIQGLLLVGAASIATIVGGIGAFTFRNAEYYRTEERR